MDKKEKQLFIDDLHTSLSASEIAVVVKQNGLTVSESNSLRKKLFEANANYKVTKNTLAKIAIRGTQFDVLENDFSGPTAIAFSKDPVAVAKVICEFAKKTDGRLDVVSGVYNGSVLSRDGVVSLSTLPSLDELKSKLIAIIMTPAQNVFSCVRGVPEKLARVVNEYAKK